MISIRMLEELIELGIVGVASMIIVGFMYDAEREFFKFSNSNDMKAKGGAAVYVIVIAIFVGWVSQGIPSLLRQHFPYYYIQSTGFILAGGWYAVHQMVTDWNLEIPSTDDRYELIILIGIVMLFLPFFFN
jgi:protein-S-isoprenylcysteine O-methyltransferase Ste14